MRAEDLERFEMVTIDENTGFPMLGPYRFLMCGPSNLKSLQRDLEKSVGREQMSVILARFGYAGGMTWATVLAELYDFDSPEELLRACGRLTTMAGLGHIEFSTIEVDIKSKFVRFSGTWRESFEYSLWHSASEKSDEPVCRLMTGLVAGFARAIVASEVLVRETACQAQGHHICSFEGRSAQEWGVAPHEVREQFDLKPIDQELSNLRTALDQAKEYVERQDEEIRLLKHRVMHPTADHEVIFRSESMGHLLFLAEKVAPTESTVLIEGESGTGKDVLAQFIHRHSGRMHENFLAINCAALPANLLESELFGYVKGAFTGADKDKKGLFEEAGKGTIFLDEVAELPIELQAKLLRALQEKQVRPVGGLKDYPVHARIIAATNRDLKDLVKAGGFREDLYYRLAVFPILVSPLRERRQDILLLARHFIHRLNKDHPGLSPLAVRKMESYTWPGNVRELENWIEYAVVMAGGDLIRPEHLPLVSAQDEEKLLSTIGSDLPTYEELEKRYTKLVLKHTNGNKTETARILGTSISTLWRKLKHDKP